jgi:diguanylate cyclase (GGDEF)-like protein
VARHGHTSVSRVWLGGWLAIVFHFAASLFSPQPGEWGRIVNFAAIAALVIAAELFMWAAVPYRNRPSSRFMIAVLMGTNLLYIGLLFFAPAASWTLLPAAILMGALPLALALLTLQRFMHPLRWTVVAMALALSAFLLKAQHQQDHGAIMALYAILFTAYLGCAIHFWFAYRRATAGAFITIAGFFIWAAVFVVGPNAGILFPHFHIESEVWNLPKYIVAIGMILLVLEDQIEHNKYLALHDELTGLPNRRLFQDRLTSALDRAQRTGTQTALLLIDLNRFKEVNDTAGHHIGDELLKCISDLFRGRVRRSDTVARTGGDEFSVILEEPTTREDALRVSQTLVRLLDRSFELRGHTVTVGASVGVAIFPDDAQDAESLCIAADLRMYADKRKSEGHPNLAAPLSLVPPPVPL